MPSYYDFDKDLPIAQSAEKEVAALLRSAYNANILEFRHDNKYDIKAKIGNKTFTFEVKQDFTCAHTGNVGVEFECRGRKSGISVSKSDYYVYIIHRPDGKKVFILPTKNIKNMIARKEYSRIVSGGDRGSNSMNYLFTYETFISHGKQIG